MLKLLQINIKLFFRDYPAVFFTLIFCPILVLIFGVTMGNDPNPLFNGLGSVDISIPVYMVIIIAGVSLLSFPISYAGSKERGELRRQKMMPVSSMTFLVLDGIVYLLLALVGMLLTAIIGKIIYNTPWADNIWTFIIGILISFISIFSMGVLLAIVCKTAKTAQALGFALFFMMLFLSGASTPLEMMNEKMLEISDYIPLKYSVVLIRKIWVGDPLSEVVSEIGVLLLIMVVCIALSLFVIHYNVFGGLKRKDRILVKN